MRIHSEGFYPIYKHTKPPLLGILIGLGAMIYAAPSNLLIAVKQKAYKHKVFQDILILQLIDLFYVRMFSGHASKRLL